ncbi:hypothetical protein BPT24_102 [Tenacibaculum phage pT24]|uniref:Uncharacterized protein n=1 Tax=Tenacibaculum phage pT24 TaxID=1880590 RepID=A0A1B4XWQ4_9CAUD|nr:hypothetical protein HYP10_gp102 [Tenacibaculum phage pT24]BAV39227.1 hypothetical protein BPT24_102 [Tenacibaculum phage pT24]
MKKISIYLEEKISENEFASTPDGIDGMGSVTNGDISSNVTDTIDSKTGSDLDSKPNKKKKK